MTTQASKFKRGDHVQVTGYGGVAFWYDELVNENTATVIMVGDDYRHTVPIEDITSIDEDEFCGGCGQIGCGW